VLLRGGGQERGIRAGTENVAGIAGMAAAICVLSAGLEPEATRLASLRDRIEAEIAEVAADVVFFGQGAERLPNTSCFAIPGFEAQVLLMILDMEGVAVSSGSACSSGKVKSSHVLAAMGVEPNLAKGAVRVSLGRTSRPEDCLLLNGALKKTVRKMSGRRAKGTVETDQVPA
jgi:cysteine desulfurase